MIRSFGCTYSKAQWERDNGILCLGPNAVEMRLTGTFNGWNGEGEQLERIDQDGIWFLSVNRHLKGELKKI